MRISKLQKDRQNNGTKNKDKQNITHKSEDRVTRTPLKSGGELMCSERVDSFCSTKLTNTYQNKNI